MEEEGYTPEQGEEDIYEESGRGSLSDDDEISPEEEAFLKGYEEADSDEEEKEKEKE